MYTYSGNQECKCDIVHYVQVRIQKIFPGGVQP